MQLRITQGPYVTLGVPEGAPLEQVRSAFLALTKQFHPARFGRMAIDIQRLSNEVFLGIKAAHDSLVKALGGGKRAAQSGGIPVLQPDGSTRASGGAAGRAGASGAIPVQARQTGAMPPVDPRQTGPIPATRPGTPGFRGGAALTSDVRGS